MPNMREFFKDFKSKIQAPAVEKTFEEKQQELNIKSALAFAELDRRLIELSGGINNG